MDNIYTIVDQDWSVYPDIDQCHIYGTPKSQKVEKLGFTVVN